MEIVWSSETSPRYTASQSKRLQLESHRSENVISWWICGPSPPPAKSVIFCVFIELNSRLRLTCLIRTYFRHVFVVRLPFVLCGCGAWLLRLRKAKWNIRGYIQKFPDCVDNEINNNNNNNKHSLRINTKDYGVKLTILTHKTAIQLHLVAEKFTICSSRSRRPVRKLLVTPSYISHQCY
jgi:hypothetical protein